MINASKKIKDAHHFSLQVQQENTCLNKEKEVVAKECTRLKSEGSKKDNVIKEMKESVKLIHQSNESTMKRKDHMIDRVSRQKKDIEVKAAQEQKGLVEHMKKSKNECKGLRDSKNQKIQCLRNVKQNYNRLKKE